LRNKFRTFEQKLNCKAKINNIRQSLETPSASFGFKNAGKKKPCLKPLEKCISTYLTGPESGGVVLLNTLKHIQENNKKILGKLSLNYGKKRLLCQLLHPLYNLNYFYFFV